MLVNGTRGVVYADDSFVLIMLTDGHKDQFPIRSDGPALTKMLLLKAKS